MSHLCVRFYTLTLTYIIYPYKQRICKMENETSISVDSNQKTSSYLQNEDATRTRQFKSKRVGNGI